MIAIFPICARRLELRNLGFSQSWAYFFVFIYGLLRLQYCFIVEFVAYPGYLHFMSRCFNNDGVEGYYMDLKPICNIGLSKD